MKIGPKSQAQEPVERNMLVVYNSQIDKILAQYPKFPGMSVSDVGRRTYKQSRDYYSGQAVEINRSIAQFQSCHPFVFQQPNSLRDACVMLKNNAVALPVQTSGAVVRGILSAGGVLLGIFSGVIQRCLGGTGFKLQKELCDVLGLLLQAFAIDVPNIIIDQFSHQRARTTTDYLALREKIQTHHAEYILRHEKTVLELERQAAKWNAAGPQSIYNDINQAMQDIQNKCANAAIDLLLKKT